MNWRFNGFAVIAVLATATVVKLGESKPHHYRGIGLYDWETLPRPLYILIINPATCYYTMGDVYRHRQ